jgi:hypothetical protein
LQNSLRLGAYLQAGLFVDELRQSFPHDGVIVDDENPPGRIGATSTRVGAGEIATVVDLHHRSFDTDWVSECSTWLDHIDRRALDESPVRDLRPSMVG